MDQHLAPDTGEILSASQYKADRISFLTQGTVRYGDFWEFAPHVYVAAGPELTREVFRRTGAQFSPSQGAFPLPRGVRRALTPGTLLPESLNAARRCFRHNGTIQHTPMVAAEAAALARDWPRGRPEEVMPRLRRTFSRIGAGFCFGADAGTLTHAEAALARTRNNIPPSTLYLPWWVPTATRLRMRSRINALAGRIGAVMERRLTQGRARGPDLLSAMIQASSDHGTPPGPPISYLLATILVASR
ncbi:cytochrome P450 family protein [Haloactinospora alba]|uniref:hypothetical protein n=1 Tax=Haloactinospora alba TaxID=405555 RepID=UPI00114F9BE0|nr:hypothetical protein [Haloactinospora alba]